MIATQAYQGNIWINTGPNVLKILVLSILNLVTFLSICFILAIDFRRHVNQVAAFFGVKDNIFEKQKKRDKQVRANKGE